MSLLWLLFTLFLIVLVAGVQLVHQLSHKPKNSPAKPFFMLTTTVILIVLWAFVIRYSIQLGWINLGG